MVMGVDGTVKRFSRDHGADDEEERDRIEAIGGRISRSKHDMNLSREEQNTRNMIYKCATW